MDKIYSLVTLALAAHDFAAKAQEHFEIDPANTGFLDTAYWLCADLRDQIERAADELDPDDPAALQAHLLASTWYDAMQGTCDELVSAAEAHSHTIRRS